MNKINEVQQTKKKTTRKKPVKSRALTLRQNKIKKNKEALVSAMNKTLGNITKSCDMVGLDRGTFYNYLNSDEDFATKCYESQEIALDFAESQLFNLMAGATETVRDEEGNVRVLKKSPNAAAIIFYLKTRGKKRGYIENGDDGSTEPIKVSYEGFTEEEMKMIESAKNVE